MLVFKAARFRVSQSHITEAEAAIAEFAAYVRESLDDSSWSSWQAEGSPGEYLSILRADDEFAVARHSESEGARRFAERLTPLLDGEIESTTYQPIADSAARLDAPAISLRGREDLTDLSDLTGAKHLRRLNLTGCAGLANLDALADCAALEWINLTGCRALTDLTGLTGGSGVEVVADAWLDLPPGDWLRALDVTHVEHIPDLAAWPRLQRLKIRADFYRDGAVAWVYGLCGISDLAALESLEVGPLRGAVEALQGLGWTGVVDERGNLNIEGHADVQALLTLVRSLRGGTSREVPALAPLLPDLALMPALEHLISTARHHAGLEQLPQVKRMELKVDVDQHSLPLFPEGAGVEQLRITPKAPSRGRPKLTNLDGLRALTGLRSLELDGLRSVGGRALAVLSELPALSELTVRGCPRITDLHFARHLPGVQVLRILNVEAPSQLVLRGLEALVTVRELDFTGSEIGWAPGDIEALRGLGHLERLVLDGATPFEGLGEQTRADGREEIEGLLARVTAS